MAIKSMRRINTSVIRNIFFLLVATVLPIEAQQKVTSASFDVKDYKMDLQVLPDDNRLNATVDVTLTPSTDTRNLAFELNGSLIVESVTRVSFASAGNIQIGNQKKDSKTATPSVSVLTFVQDRAGNSSLGPSVRIDLGEIVKADSSVTLRFKYSGTLVTPEGGPLLTKRLAYIGAENGYLLYAARWFPFNDYAADRATSDITISLPKGFTVAGYSDEVETQGFGKQRFVQREPGLVGNFAYDKFTIRKRVIGEREIKFFSKTVDDAVIDDYAETLGKALAFYTTSFGPSPSAKRMTVVQIDDESLDFYSTQGMIFVATRLFEQSRTFTKERLEREAALQWWGLNVGLKSFDDAWLSQGLSEFSAYSFRESKGSPAKIEALRREMLEKALTFDQTSSIARAPSALDDQSTAYQYIMYGKGAFIFRLLKESLGEQKFKKLLSVFVERYAGRNASIDDFEQLTSEIAGENMRYFFARWVEGTGVPEFKAEYEILRTRDGRFITRGTVRQNYDGFKLPLELQLKSEGDLEAKPETVFIEDASADFNLESQGKPLDVVIDPNLKILRTSEDLKISSIARRGIEQFKEGNLVEAQQQFEAALKMDRSSAWIYYHLGLVFLEQRNYDQAIDNFKVITQSIKSSARPGWLHVWSFIKLGNAYDAKGDRPRAIDAYKKAEELRDDYDGAQDAVKKYQATPYDPKKKS